MLYLLGDFMKKIFFFLLILFFTILRGINMFKKLSLILLTLFLTLGIWATDVNAQSLQDMTLSVTNGSYNPISGMLLTTGDDQAVGIHFPFDFKWDNHLYKAGTADGIIASTNGYLWMVPPKWNFRFWYWRTPIHKVYPSIQAIRGDLITNGRIEVTMLGVAPNRVLIFQWSNVVFYRERNPRTGNMNFQVRLYETSNNVEIIYGQMSKGSYNGTEKYFCGFTGYYSQANQYTRASWIEVIPGAPFSSAWSSKNGGAPTRGTGSITVSNFGNLRPGTTISLTAFPALVETFPTNGSIFRRGDIYTGTQHPAMIFKRIATQPNVFAKFSISGPLPADPVNNPDFRTIYTGTQADYTNTLFTFNPQPVGTAASVNIPYATGIAAGANGEFDLQTNQNQIVGGEYIVESEMHLPGFNFVQKLPSKTFIIALDFDLAVTKILNPRKKQDFKYPLYVRIPIRGRFANVGITTFNTFDAQALIIANNGTDTIYNQTIQWPTNPPQTLATGDWVDIDFPTFYPTIAGDYQLVFKATPTDPTRDDEMNNNILPKVRDNNFYFTVAYELEAEPVKILIPSDSIYVGRPVLPLARFRNNGVSDISDAPATIKIWKNIPPYDVIFTDNVIVQDIPSGRYNTTDAFFNSNFIPPSAGSYGVSVSINLPEDPITSNNTYTSTFYVIDAMAGTYTIGTRYAGSPRNFMTIDEALDALYLQGVTGPCTFLLTDATYNIGDPIMETPAWDMSGKIIGVSEDNPITFKPSQDKSLYKGSVTINLNTAGGVGVYIAQNMEPSNRYAAIHHVTTGLKRDYANSDGYITFDGGSQKSLKFVLNTSNDFNAVFYLGKGAAHNTIKNCLVKTNTSSCADLLPKTKYDAAFSGFYYEKDIRTYGTYSTGILLRNIYPKDKKDNSNIYRLDTNAIAYNQITRNEISGFAYGVVSIGIGPLYNESKSVYERFYNKHNEITHNEIYNLCRAGIFMGHEENSTVAYNRIYHVESASNSAYGILLGGQGNSQWFGYNNISLSINGNEISDVTSSVMSGGIVSEQAKNLYPFSNPSFVSFPDTDENIHISNNAIWDLNTSSETAARAGIHVFTERQLDRDFMTMMTTPKIKTYYTKNDQIINNTVWLRSDNNGISSNSVVFGIALQQTDDAVLYNNAVALTDAEVQSSATGYAGFFLQGVMPKDGSLISDRNAFWTSNAADASYFHFIEMDENGDIIEVGARDDYKELTQWQNWTGQDFNSAVGDFTQDYVFEGTAPKQQLRINDNPAPLGSILNNRGNKVDWVKYDIDGITRGAAGQRYDVGHVEFDGRLYLSDMEAIKITAPAAYKAGSGFFSDAQYIMTTAPVNIKGLFRNSGNLPQNSVTATVYVYREQPDGLFSNVPELTTTTLVTAPTTQTVEADWKLADGVAPDFAPLTYSDLSGLGYVAPDEFVTMEANVTPKYKIVIAIGADQNNANNKIEKVVRFYLAKSSLRMILSAENSFQNLDNTSTSDEVAGKLNYQALVDGLGLLGWAVDANKEQFDYDIFDRLGWEPKAVNYTNYRTMFWADGDDAPMTRYERIDIKRFLAGGNTIEKRNLIIGSQELVREHMNGSRNADADFVGGILRSDYVTPGNPLGANADNDSNEVVGISVFRKVVNNIYATHVTNDVPPYCGLVSVNPLGEGLATPAFYYVNHNAATSDSIGGVTTTTLTRNVCYYAVDWRHWGDLEMLIRASIDYIEKNGGTIIPVELVSFDAIARGRQVELSWVTASEYNSDKFEIERAVKNESGVSAFTKIAEENANGSSVSEIVYGPITDRNVELGQTYIYRLKVVDLSGEFSYSEEREVKVGGDNTSWLSAPVPNPVTNIANIEFNVAEAGQVEISLFDMGGKLVRTLLNEYSNTGVHSFRINANELMSGQYSIVMKSNGEQFVTYIQIVK